MNSSKRILFAANDPGGANAILPVVRSLITRGDTCAGFVSGPAKVIFERARIEFTDVDTLDESELLKKIRQFDPMCLLAGTNAANDSIDKRIRTTAPNLSSVYVLDFWSNYALRFSSAGNDLAHLPTIVCVMDALARDEMIADGIPAERIRVTGNPYMEHFTEGISSEHEDQHEVLFVSQPIRELDVGRYGFDQYIVLDHLIRALDLLPPTYRLFIRPHPKDDPHAFERYFSERVDLSEAATLEESLSGAGLIIGMFSPVLIQAAAAGKRVLSYEPNLIGPDPLPTNRMGLTTKAGTEEELRSVFTAYAAGNYPAGAIDLGALWPKGATERILKIVDEIAA